MTETTEQARRAYDRSLEPLREMAKQLQLPEFYSRRLLYAISEVPARIEQEMLAADLRVAALDGEIEANAEFVKAREPYKAQITATVNVRGAFACGEIFDIYRLSDVDFRDYLTKLFARRFAATLEPQIAEQLHPRLHKLDWAAEAEKIRT
jgi:hypothetical protein